jgi:hypothetical protein
MGGALAAEVDMSGRPHRTRDRRLGLKPLWMTNGVPVAVDHAFCDELLPNASFDQGGNGFPADKPNADAREARRVLGKERPVQCASRKFCWRSRSTVHRRSF